MSTDDRLDAIDAKLEQMDTKFTKRFEQMDTKFTKRFEEMDVKFTKQLDAITKVVVTGFASVNERFEQVATKEEIRTIMRYLDDVIKKQEISEQERVVIGHQLDRLDKWTHELAKKIGYTLSA